MTTPIVIPPCDSDNLKRCTNCGEPKPREAFSNHRYGKDGLAQITSRACAYLRANAAHIHAQKRECMIEYNKTNTERIREYKKKRSAERKRIRRESSFA